MTTSDHAPPRWPGDARPDWAPGNLASVRSGAWSPRLVAETMAELRPRLQAIIDEAPWCRPVDELALVDFLRDMARAERLEVGWRSTATATRRATSRRASSGSVICGSWARSGTGCWRTDSGSGWIPRPGPA